jgi:hypothetical protein
VRDRYLDEQLGVSLDDAKKESVEELPVENDHNI